jgi:hypothetical protein
VKNDNLNPAGCERKEKKRGEEKGVQAILNLHFIEF